MRAMMARQRLVRTAAATASVVLLAACGTKAEFNPAAGSADPSASPTGPTYAAGELAVSNATNVVDVGGRKVTFPTTVSEAVWSQDGSRLAFVDADGNIATARPDGTSLTVLTKKLDGVVRSRPVWYGSEIRFASTKGNAKPAMMTVFATDNVDNDKGGSPSSLGLRVDGGDPVPGNEAAPSTSDLKTTRISGDGVEVAFQRQGGKGPEIWVVDLNQRDAYQSKLVDGTEPALSPDGKKLAYVDKAGQIEVVVTTGSGKPTPVQITFGANAPTHLVWTPDASKVAFQTPSDVEAVAAQLPAGATSNPTSQLAATSGRPTFLRSTRDKLTKITGADPVATSIAASQARWPTQESPQGDPFGVLARAAVLVGTNNLPTVLAGAQVVDQGPLLFTTGSGLDPRTAAELKRIFGKVGEGEVVTVTIIGGTDVVPAQAETAVRAMGYKTNRISAKDPVSMSVAVAGSPARARIVFVVDWHDTAGYLAAISGGGSTDQAVLLTDGPTVSDGVGAFLDNVPKAAKIYAVGGVAQAALTTSWSGKPAGFTATPLVGADAGGSPALLFHQYVKSPTTVALVNAASPADVIVAIGAARPYGAPILVVDPKSGPAGLDKEVAAWLDKSSASTSALLIVDSSGGVSAGTEARIGDLAGGPLGHTTEANPKAPKPF